MHFWKIISIFYKKYLKKEIGMLALIDSALHIAKLSAMPLAKLFVKTLKQKQGWLVKASTK